MNPTCRLILIVSAALLVGRPALAQPQLHITPLADQVMLSWSNSPPYYGLEWRAAVDTGLWDAATNPVHWVNGQSVCTNPISAPSQFFRLKSASTNTQVTIDVPLYANLHGRWDYQDTKVGEGGVGPWSVEVLGITNRNGEGVYLLQEYDESGSPNDQTFYHTNLSEGLFQTGGLNDYGQPSEMEFYWHPFLPALMKTFVPGAEYTNYATRPDYPGLVAEIRLKTDAETVTVPYGTFHCCKATQTIGDSNQVYVVHTFWFAENIGLVKRMEISDGAGAIWELTAYQP